MLRGADIEIIERRINPEDRSGFLVPNAVRINGTEVAIPDGACIKAHDITDQNCVTVTITLFASSVTIRTEAPS
ncbi:hypothetical protein [Streptomyces sp. MZ04]|uniref:hypothetical protein n=1 Tax=Streptomyces sp. MZ04 TaxID=2559236 RepID=UPI00107E9095|nr:hypothetical protein [Streptomyces sp. MZ04]TGB13854.1 hypothetical protein E2651_07905 [Streptomyces sp. MZ04]